MPRLGMNPNRGRKLDGYTPSRVTLAVLTYLPAEAGYFAERLDVTRLCLASLRANTPPDCDLLVFDNGSAQALTTHLQALHARGAIDYLVLSRRNIGKINALRTIFKMAPGEIVAYTDDDVYFMPGWLDEHLKILDTFPDVGLVTGFYIRSHTAYAMQSNLQFAQRTDVQLQRGLLNEERWEQHYRNNMGRSAAAYARETAGLQDIEVTYQGVAAFLSAGHHQFVAPRRVLLDALGDAWDENLMGGMVALEEAIDAAGYLRLSTRQPVTRLLGNRLGEEMAAEARRLGLNALSAPAVAASLPWPMNYLMRSGRVRVWVRRLHDTLFRWLELTKHERMKG